MKRMHALALDAGPHLDTDALTAAYAPDPSIPALRLNFVSSIDGAATVHGKSAPLGTPADKQVFGLLRRLCDGLMVGAGTIRDEKYRAIRSGDEQRHWRVEHGLQPYPRLVIVSSRLDLNPSAAVFTDAPVRPIVMTHRSSPAAGREALAEVADVIVHGVDEVDLPGAIGELREAYALDQLLCEGGPHLFASLYAADLVDELCLTVSPTLAGPGADRIIVGGPGSGEPATIAMRLRHAIAADSALLLRYVRAESPQPG
jgi:riboflavin biosynthesis pyrimidine reductase